MSVDSVEFRQALGLFPTGVTVVAVAVGEGVRAMTVGSFTSLSLDPPLVLFCVGKKTRLAEVLAVGRPFSVNVLRADQQALSTYFAGGWKEPTPPPHRFVPWGGGARLEGVAASIGGELSSLVDGGDHLIAIGTVTALVRGLPPIDPLVFFDRRYRTVDRSTGQSAPELDPTEATTQLFHESW
jgi:flavin reductase (DIM6/NTAB) family NADH-FMN oxidoreductase RutF